MKTLIALLLILATSFAQNENCLGKITYKGFYGVGHHIELQNKTGCDMAFAIEFPGGTTVATIKASTTSEVAIAAKYQCGIITAFALDYEKCVTSGSLVACAPNSIIKTNNVCEVLDTKLVYKVWRQTGRTVYIEFKFSGSPPAGSTYFAQVKLSDGRVLKVDLPLDKRKGESFYHKIKL